MTKSTTQAEIMLWHFTCPSCGFGSDETGYFAATHMIYCEICLEEGESVKLRRRPKEDSGAAARGGLRRG